MALRLTVLISILGAAAAVSVRFYEEVEPAVWLESEFGLNLTDAERTCASMGQVLYQGSCYNLLQRGPCERYEWLVLNPDNPEEFKPKCRTRLCAPGYGYFSHLDRCFPQSLCPPGTSFHYDLLGNGECLCKGLAVRASTPNGVACVELFKRGFCPEGSVLVPVFRLSTNTAAECVPDPCAEPGTSGNASDEVSGEESVRVLLRTGEEKCLGRRVLNLTCDLFMAPLFPLSGVKVPLCVELFLRNGVWSSAKVEDCAMRDDGSCAKKVDVNTLEPTDWEFD